VLANDERSLRTPHPKLHVAKAREVDAAWLEGLVQWLKSNELRDDDQVRRDLKRWVPEYEPQKATLRVIQGKSASSSDAKSTNN
jgi:hypothetical protein